MINWIFNHVAISITAVSAMIGEHAHGFISSDRIVKHDTLCFIHNLRLPHHLLLIFLLSEAMTSPGSRDNNSDETRPEDSLNMTQFRCFHLGNSRACFVVFALCKVFLFNWVSNICTWKYIYTQHDMSHLEH